MKNNNHTSLLYLFVISIFCFISCGIGDAPQTNGATEIEENAEYMKAHPECIIGTYYNYFTQGAISYIELRADHTFKHVFKFNDLNYADSGKWNYSSDNGQNRIILAEFKFFKEETGDNRGIETIYFPLLGCNELFLSEDDEKMNFYKVKPSNIK